MASTGYKKIRHNKDLYCHQIGRIHVIQLIFKATQPLVDQIIIFIISQNASDFTVKSKELSERVKGSLTQGKKIFCLIKSKLLGKELIKPLAHLLLY